VKAKCKMILKKITEEKYYEEKNRKRTVFVRKRTVCAGRGCTNECAHPNISTQLRVKMFHPRPCNLAAAALTHLRP